MTNKLDNIKPTRDRLVIDIERCTGCRLCQIACSMQHFGRPDPRLARIKVLQFQDPDLNIPIICMSCEDAPCIKACPVNARIREDNHCVVTVEERCIGCGACIFICPAGSPVRNPATKKTMTCDMCLEDASEPWCVTSCRDEGALRLCKSNGPTYSKSHSHAKNKLPDHQKAANRSTNSNSNSGMNR